MITVYGIPNCDSVKKARRWLDEQSLPYQFHDLRRDGVPKEPLEHWINTFGWAEILNRRSKSWRELDPDIRAQMDNTRAYTAALEQPTLIKRPIVTTDTQVLVGFDPQKFEQLL